MIGHPKEFAKGDRSVSVDENKAPVDPDNDLSRGAPYDRDQRIEQMRKDTAKNRGGEKRYERKPEDLDREDDDIQREGIAGEKPGIRPQGDADFVRDKG